MGVIQVQTDFTHGELSPVMRGRYDTALYRKGCQKMTNMLVLPQGAATKRFGLEFVLDTLATVDEYQLFEFSSVEGVNFLLILENNSLRIFKEDGTEHLNSPLVFPFIGQLLVNSEVKFSQTHDQAMFVHRTVRPQVLKFKPLTNTFVTQPFTFKNAPTFDFQDVDYSGTSFILSVVEVGQISTLSSTPLAVFDDEHVGGVFIAAGPDASSPLGFARINSVTSPTIASVTIINAFHVGYKAIAISGKNTLLEKVALSDLPVGNTRGWPRSVAFYESRLIFGGSKSLPQTIMMSQIDDYKDFNTAAGQDDNAIIVTISSNKSSAINDVVADRSLQVFTESGEFAPPQLTESALTASSISIRKQSSIGSDKRNSPVNIDNVTFYVQNGGRAVLAFVYQDTTASYESVASSTVSNHLIANVIDMTTLKGRNDSDANFLFTVNNGVVERVDETLPKGTISAFQSLAEQNIKAWTPIVTKNGIFKRVQSVGQTLFTIVERTIGGVPKQYLEKSNFDKLTDSGKSIDSLIEITTVTGLSHLEGQVVDVIADGFALPQHTVVNGGITVKNPAKVFEVGIPMRPELKIMPISVEGDTGPLLPIPQRVVRYFIDLLNSQGVEVNGVLIPNLLFSEGFIEGPLPLRTGLFEISNLAGWDSRQAITLTQNGPFKMTVLGIGYEVDL